MNAITGSGCSIDQSATVGYEHETDTPAAELGDNWTVRAGTIIYAAIDIGEDFATGHNALVREGMTGEGTAHTSTHWPAFRPDENHSIRGGRKHA